MSSKQIKASWTTLASIMATTAFGRGVRDVRAGLPHRADTDWTVNEQWDYERGRAWATVAPHTMPLRIAGRLNPAAVRVAEQAGVVI
jgi:hypothetical protein